MRLSMFAAGAFAALALVGVLAGASARSADTGFGNRGWVRVGGGYAGVADIVVRPNGRIVVLNSDSWLQQRLDDGSVDDSFDAGAVADQPGGYCCANGALALQPDARLLVASEKTLTRFTPTGHLDESFGKGGRVALAPDQAAGLALAPDGKIVVGLTDPSATVGAVVRFRPGGQADASFGAGGRLELPAGGIPWAVAVQRDGGILVAGRGEAVSRYLVDGSPDRAFAARAGSALDGLIGYALTLQPDGKIVIAGYRIITGVGAETDVARLFADGRLDAGFGTGGIVSFRWPGFVGIPAGLAVLPDGAVALAGAILPTCPCKGADWLAMRIAADGTVRSVPVPGDGPDPEHDCWGGSAGAVTVQADGKTLFGGDMCDRGDSSAFLGRLTSDFKLDAGPPLKAYLDGIRTRSIDTKARVTARLRTSDAASVTVWVRGQGGAAARLLRGSLLGGSQSRTPTSLRASFAHAATVRVVLVFAPHPKTRYSIEVRAVDTRDRNARLRVPIPATR